MHRYQEGPDPEAVLTVVRELCFDPRRTSPHNVHDACLLAERLLVRNNPATNRVHRTGEAVDRILEWGLLVPRTGRDFPSGWITPEGEIRTCAPWSHDALLDVLGIQVHRAEDAGWLRRDGAYRIVRFVRRPNSRQIRLAEHLGFPVNRDLARISKAPDQSASVVVPEPACLETILGRLQAEPAEAAPACALQVGP